MPRLLLLLVIALLAGCGQKGALYLPTPAVPAAPAPAATGAATDAAPQSEDRERAVPAAQP